MVSHRRYRIGIGVAALLVLAVGLIVGRSALARAPQPVASVPAPSATAACGTEPTVTAQVSGQPALSVEIASTPAEQEQGLMFRRSLPADAGMLFVFDQPTQTAFWMHNTYIPLSVAWMDPSGTIVDIQDMQPLTDTDHQPRAQYVYALEANQGWFRQHGVTIGDTMRICFGAPSPVPTDP